MQTVWRTDRRTNPYKNKHALLLQLSFISHLHHEPDNSRAMGSTQLISFMD